MESATRLLASDPALWLARRTCYRFVALALADPRSGTYGELANPATHDLVAQAAEILKGEDAAVARPLAPGERPLADLDPAPVFARLPRSAGELNEAYEAAFGLLGGSKCPPYETEYLPSKFTFQRSNTLADVAGFYHAFGLQTSTSNPDRPDHIVLQCEFLAQLLQLEWQAAQLATQSATPDGQLDADICQQAVRRFLKEHFAWWAPAFAKLLAHQDSGGFYEAVASFLAALVASERALAQIDPPRLSVEPSLIENSDECSGCQLAIH
jgi:TorA maturation chaperone TorD